MFQSRPPMYETRPPRRWPLNLAVFAFVAFAVANPEAAAALVETVVVALGRFLAAL